MLSQFPGNVPVAIYDESSNKAMLLPRDKQINRSDALMKELKKLVGQENVKISVR